MRVFPSDIGVPGHAMRRYVLGGFVPGPGPADMGTSWGEGAEDHHGRFLLVTDPGGGTLRVLDIALRRWGPPVPDLPGTTQVLFDPLREVFWANCPPRQEIVEVAEGSQGFRVLHHQPVECEPGTFTLDPLTGWVLLLEAVGRSLVAVDPYARVIRYEQSLSSPAVSLAAIPGPGRVAVAFQRGEVHLLDTPSGSLARTLPSIPGAPTRLLARSGGKEVVVSTRESGLFRLPLTGEPPSLLAPLTLEDGPVVELPGDAGLAAAQPLSGEVAFLEGPRQGRMDRVFVEKGPLGLVADPQEPRLWVLCSRSHRVAWLQGEEREDDGSAPPGPGGAPRP